MRKILSLVLALCMVMSINSALAAEITPDSDSSANTTVVYGVTEGYIITVPDGVAVGQPGVLTVTASNVMLSTSTALHVYIDGESFNNSMWHLTDVNNSANKLSYAISDGAYTVHPGDVVLRVEAGEAVNTPATATLYLQLTDEVTLAGTYNDILTFTVAVEYTANSLYGTFILDLDNAETAASAIQLTDEDNAMLENLKQSYPDEYYDMFLEYLLDTYGISIVPVADSVNYDEYRFYWTKATPVIEYNGEYLWVYLEEYENGDSAVYADSGFDWFFAVFAFEATEDMPEVSLNILRQYAQKLSNDISPFFNLDISGATDINVRQGHTWQEWAMSIFYESEFQIIDGYVYYYDAQIYCNGEPVVATDVIQWVDYYC